MKLASCGIEFGLQNSLEKIDSLQQKTFLRQETANTF